MRGDGGDVALRTGGVGAGEVEGAEQAGHIEPIQIGVHSAARGVRGDEVLERGAADGPIQPSRHGQQGVARRLKIQPAAVHLP